MHAVEATKPQVLAGDQACVLAALAIAVTGYLALLRNTADGKMSSSAGPPVVYSTAQYSTPEIYRVRSLTMP